MAVKSSSPDAEDFDSLEYYSDEDGQPYDPDLWDSSSVVFPDSTDPSGEIEGWEWEGMDDDGGGIESYFPGEIPEWNEERGEDEDEDGEGSFGFEGSEEDEGEGSGWDW